MKAELGGSVDRATRTEARQRTLYAIGRLVIEGRQRVCTVRNVSDNGIGIELDRPLALGTRLEIEMRGLPLTPAEVCWVNGTRAGLALHRGAIGATTPRSNFTLRSPRFRFTREIGLRSAVEEAPARAIDVALGGVKLSAPIFAPPGTSVVASLDGQLEIRARVCWHLPHAFGLRFAVPLSARQLTALLERTAQEEMAE